MMQFEIKSQSTDNAIMWAPGLGLKRFAIKSRWTGNVSYTAKIEADDDTSDAIKLGRAVIRAIKAGADLRGAGLRGVDLREADMREADLRGADLRGADLRGADLRGADLRGAGIITEEGE